MGDVLLMLALANPFSLKCFLTFLKMRMRKETMKSERIRSNSFNLRDYMTAVIHHKHTAGSPYDVKYL